MRITRATRLILAVVSVAAVAGCTSDNDKAVAAVTGFYQAAVRGDCATALTYASPSFISDHGESYCTQLRGYQIVDIAVLPNTHSYPPEVGVDLRSPRGGRDESTWHLISGPGDGFLMNHGGATT